MLPYRWCIELQRVVRETFKEMEFRNKSLLYRAFLHPTFCGLNQQYTADGLLEVGKSVLRYIYTTSLLHSFPDFLTDNSASIEKVVEDLSKPRIVAETCLAEWKNLGSMVLTDLGISKLRNVFSPKCWSLKEPSNALRNQPQFHYVTGDSDPAKFHPELAGLPIDGADVDDHCVTPGREKYYNVPFEETLGYAFVGALYYDKGLPATMAFVKMYMLKYAIGCLLEETE
ncbi:hypothetical protein XU18_4892 [Perkinsela sp. CCAP 1560/4]|nr:hypothetical protein XU18_4892 [Perkinsela sp. CCAP 1560/4]|eukprot:KNH03816.1 hypothetical protein XU18_4892 [Perkinsela sp. CCAP 1560/4]